MRKTDLLLPLMMVAASACGPSVKDGTSDSQLADSENAPVVSTLIDEFRCQQRVAGQMGGCGFPAMRVDSAATHDADVPVRTTFKVTRAGECTSSYQLEYVVSDASGSEVARYPFLGGQNQVLERIDARAFGSLTITASQQWWNIATLPLSCRIVLEVLIDVPHVTASTVDQWRSRFAALKTSAEEAHESAIAYDRLIDSVDAFVFVDALVTTMHESLTDATYAKLRANATKYQATIKLIVQNNTAGLTLGQRAALNRLHLMLGTVDDRTTWENPDGSLKKIADFLSEADATRLAVAKSLSTPEKRLEYASHATHFRDKAAQMVPELQRLETLINRYGSIQ